MAGLLITDLLISLLGFPIGIIIGLFTKEELVVSKKYLLMVKNILSGLILLLILLFIITNLKPSLVIPLLIIISLVITNLILEIKSVKPKLNFNKIDFYKVSSLINFYLIIILAYLINNDPRFQLWLAGLAFLYGFPSGTLFYHDHKNLPQRS